LEAERILYDEETWEDCKNSNFLLLYIVVLLINIFYERNA
jgi:hypothetical protein